MPRGSPSAPPGSVSRWRDPDAIVAELEPHEPGTTAIVAPVIERGTSRHVRVWRLDRTATGELAAVLCATRVCLDRWRAAVYEVDEGAADAFLPLLRRLPVRGLSGPTDVVVRLAEQHERVRAVSVQVFLDAPAPLAHLGDADPRTRLAHGQDLPDLVDLYAEAGLDAPPTRPRLKRFLADAVRRGKVIVLQDGDEVVGAMRIDHLSRRYGWTSQIVVRPDHRGEGLSWAIFNFGLHHLLSLHVGMLGSLTKDNPMRPHGALRAVAEARLAERPAINENFRPWMDRPDDLTEDDPTWAFATFDRRRTVPGSGWLWRGLELVEGPSRPSRRLARLRGRLPGHTTPPSADEPAP